MKLNQHIATAISNRDSNSLLSKVIINGLPNLILSTYFPCKTQYHKTHKGYISHSRDFIRSLIGHYFNGSSSSNTITKINEYIPIFDIAGEYTKKETTKGYRLLPWMNDLITEWLEENYVHCDLSKTEDLRSKGKAIMTEDANGKRRKTKGNIRFGVKINRDALQAAYDKVDTEEERKQVLFLLHLSNGDALPVGWVPQIYQESAAGRLYGQGLNLQNIKKSVREIALLGTYQFDMSNAHYTILHQHCKKHGVELKGIAYYLANKKAVRTTLANDTNLPMADVKTALISLIYGASINVKESKSGEKYAIRKLCESNDQFNTLVTHPLFKSIANDIDLGARMVIKTSRLKGGNYFNALGKPIAGNESKAKILAHFLQGIEAKALDAIITGYDHDIALLLHDGISFYSKQDSDELERVVLAATGYRIKFDFEYNKSESILKRPSVEGVAIPDFDNITFDDIKDVHKSIRDGHSVPNYETLRPGC